MALYNVAVAVVELVEADSQEAAIRRMVRRLENDGYHLYEGEVSSPDAFESEAQVSD